MKIAGVILAAGESKRLGRPKQLLELGGETLLARTIRIAQASRCDRIGVVLGAHRDVMAPIVEPPVAIIGNDDWEEGMGSSVRAAARFADDAGFDGVLLMVCDQPRLTTHHLDDLIARFERDSSTIGSRYAETIGVPAIFERARFAELMNLEGDRGARALLRGDKTGVIDWPDGAIDLDTPADVSAEKQST